MSLHNKVYRWNLLNHVLNEEKMTDFLIYIKKKIIFFILLIISFLHTFPFIFSIFPAILLDPWTVEDAVTIG
jgi:hypothetical protein